MLSYYNGRDSIYNTDHMCNETSDIHYLATCRRGFLLKTKTALIKTLDLLEEISINTSKEISSFLNMPQLK